MICDVTPDIIVGSDYFGPYVAICDRCGQVVDNFETAKAALIGIAALGWTVSRVKNQQITLCNTCKGGKA